MPPTTTDPCQKIVDLLTSLENELAVDQAALLKATIPAQKVALEQSIVALGIQIRSETVLLGNCRGGKGIGTGTGGTGVGGGVPAACQPIATMIDRLEAERARLWAALLAATEPEQKVLIEAQIAALGVVLVKEQQSLASCIAQHKSA